MKTETKTLKVTVSRSTLERGFELVCLFVMAPRTSLEKLPSNRRQLSHGPGPEPVKKFQRKILLYAGIDKSQGLKRSHD